MKMLHDETGQAGGLIVVVAGIFLIGFFYVALGTMMNEVQVANNDLISNSSLSYSQNHLDAMDNSFKYWSGFIIYALLIFIIYGIKNALRKEPGEV